MADTDKDTLAKTLRFKKIEGRLGCAKVGATVDGDFLNGVGIAHGGYLFSLADYASGIATNTKDITVVSASTWINFVAPCPAGSEIVAIATMAYDNGKTGVCDVIVKSADEQTVYALFQSRVITRK